MFVEMFVGNVARKLKVEHRICTPVTEARFSESIDRSPTSAAWIQVEGL